jgi:hypothetical protein
MHLVYIVLRGPEPLNMSWQLSTPEKQAWCGMFTATCIAIWSWWEAVGGCGRAWEWCQLPFMEVRGGREWWEGVGTSSSMVVAGSHVSQCMWQWHSHGGNSWLCRFWLIPLEYYWNRLKWVHGDSGDKIDPPIRLELCIIRKIYVNGMPWNFGNSNQNEHSNWNRWGSVKYSRNCTNRGCGVIGIPNQM